jgi:hypothetical protein
LDQARELFLRRGHVTTSISVGRTTKCWRCGYRIVLGWQAASHGRLGRPSCE